MLYSPFSYVNNAEFILEYKKKKIFLHEKKNTYMNFSSKMCFNHLVYRHLQNKIKFKQFILRSTKFLVSRKIYINFNFTNKTNIS